MYSFFTSVLLALSSSYAFAAPSHGISMHGELKYPKDFTHFDYVNPNAPQGGKLTLSKTGTFTTFNPLVLKGTAAPGIRGGSYGRGYIYESLMARSQDEAFSLYGLLAKSVDLSEDRSQITFNIRDEARWSDGHPLTAEDVAFSVDLYKTKGHPRLRDVAKAVTHTVSGNSITFVFKNTENRELPLLLGLMPIVPKHIIDPYFFDRTTLEIPVGSGPYVISRVQPGRQVVYKKNPNYWGKDLAVNKGHYNFQYIKYEYFRDHNSSFESFKKGIVDFWFESSPSSWATRFNFSALKSGQAKKEEIAIKTPAGMNGIVFNTRIPKFKDIRVRKALTLAFNADWVNKNLYWGKLERSQSFFSRSYLSSIGKPASDTEIELLEPRLESISSPLLAGTFRQPTTGKVVANNRKNLYKAFKLLTQAGYKVQNGVLVNAKTGQQLSIEFLASTSRYNKVLLKYASDLRYLGVKLNIRVVDSAQYWERLKKFNYETIRFNFSASLSPGNEQYGRWSSKARNSEGSLAFAGANDIEIDNLIDKILAAKEPQEFTLAVRAYDRLLLSKNYIIPWFYAKNTWVSYKSHFQSAENKPWTGVYLDSWWSNQPQEELDSLARLEEKADAQAKVLLEQISKKRAQQRAEEKKREKLQ